MFVSACPMLCSEVASGFQPLHFKSHQLRDYAKNSGWNGNVGLNVPSSIRSWRNISRSPRSECCHSAGWSWHRFIGENSFHLVLVHAHEPQFENIWLDQMWQTAVSQPFRSWRNQSSCHVAYPYSKLGNKHTSLECSRKTRFMVPELGLWHVWLSSAPKSHGLQMPLGMHP